MQFSVGDKVVHPHRGPGRIVDVERQSFLEEAKRYYVIDMPASALTVRVPVRRVDDVGLRPAMTRDKLARVLDTLHGRPRGLPMDHKERQESVRERVQTSRPIAMAEAVRDLTWHGRSAHLTKTDSELLKAVQDFLAAEIALASDTQVSEAIEAIELALTDVSEEVL
jgi:CarD family transcriptional regulator